MPALHDIQSAFRVYLLGGDAATVAALVRGHGLAPGQRLDIHRNNVRLGLTEALGQTFLVTRAVVGDEFFSAVARAFLTAHPPRSGSLLHLGGELAEFLAGYPGVAAHVPYVPDLARLEWARHEVLHGPDAVPVAPEDLSALTPEQADACVPVLHPAHRVVRAEWAVDQIWAAHQTAAEPDAIELEDRRADILVIRPRAVVDVVLLPPGGADFLEAVTRGAPFARAAAAAPDLDLVTFLTRALSEGWFVALNGENR